MGSSYAARRFFNLHIVVVSGRNTVQKAVSRARVVKQAVPAIYISSPNENTWFELYGDTIGDRIAPLKLELSVLTMRCNENSIMIS